MTFEESMRLVTKRGWPKAEEAVGYLQDEEGVVCKHASEAGTMECVGYELRQGGLWTL